MVWARLDDEILDNRKIAQAGVFGFALHVAAITYCCRNLTDGFIPFARVSGLLDFSMVNYDVANPLALPDGDESDNGDTGLSPHEVASHLANVGLWDRVPGGYRVHDFLMYNPSREEVLNQRAAAKERRKEAKQERRKNVVRTSSERNANVTRSSGRPDPDPVPEKEIPPGVPPLAEPAIEPEKKPAKARYAEAYAEGQREASGGAPFPPPTKEWDHGAIARFTDTPGWGLGLRGDDLLAGIRQWSRDFRRACDDRPKAHKGFSPEACEEWARGAGWRYRPAKPPRPPQERRSPPQTTQDPSEAPIGPQEAAQAIRHLFDPPKLAGGGT